MPRVYALNENSTNEPNDGQLAGNAQTMLEIKVKSETRSIAALDNVAGFGRSERRQRSVRTEPEEQVGNDFPSSRPNAP